MEDGVEFEIFFERRKSRFVLDFRGRNKDVVIVCRFYNLSKNGGHQDAERGEEEYAYRRRTAILEELDQGINQFLGDKGNRDIRRRREEYERD